MGRGSFDLQPYQNFPLLFTGRKLRSPGIGIEATVWKGARNELGLYGERRQFPQLGLG